MRALLLVALLLGSCSEGEHEIFVVVRTDLTPGTDFDSVTVQLFDERGALGTLLRSVDERALAGDDFATGERIAELSGVPTGDYVVRGALSLGGTPVIDGSAPVHVAADRALTIQLSASCRTVRCPPAAAPAETACIYGTCALPECLIDSRASHCPGPTDAGAPADAGDSDAGALDGGDRVDAGVDAGPTAPAGMVYVPAGRFMMGCNEPVDVACETDELPYHEVTLSAFFIDRRELSQGDYALCVDVGACRTPSGTVWDPAGHPGDPVVDVDRAAAETYCLWAGKRLPTEAEWEKAARGTDERIYPWGNDPPSCMLANYDVCGDRVEPVETHSDVPSPYGTINQAGNVWEWVTDYYAADYYVRSPSNDPQGPATGTTWVIRGSSYDWEAIALRTSRRLEWSRAVYVVGFRCALDAE